MVAPIWMAETIMFVTKDDTVPIKYGMVKLIHMLP